MPKIVDAGARRLEIADAVFRVIRRDGVDQASLRAVAAEAGLVIGSVRHYLATRDEMIVFAVRTLADRVTARIAERAERIFAGTPDRLEATVRLLAELLPHDETRTAEAEVWLAFTVAARTRPELAAEAERVHDGTRALTRRCLAEADALGSLRSGLDLALEAERLAALLDGLTLGGVTQPGRLPPRFARDVLRRHLESLRA
ncbi:TetR family transcriptional regulator C-terminal domain-containing protein [Amycolatopsis sp. SID8362]|uniref:TetR/AcrR family transcriptional regulator n=1 Tax=Amycolatopsis sp. SID8362 TaxID=2690346 RepID=UPI0013707DAC|nr:TetR family transcriptional regulator C-terminal domain-containing protein [Amycolatopsis sp. SID8362]NBH10081.1 TetR family transcriptional regulator [Amycolatopsis sp. SID8362]NED46775.1 TetR family transcriptional regulator [Amycolatopsis sp. SID8362]